MLYEEVLNREALRMYLSKSYDSESVDGRYAMALKIVSGVIQNCLTQRQREVTMLYYGSGMSLDEISQKYGERTMDRLVAITTRVKFKGDSLRK